MWVCVVQVCAMQPCVSCSRVCRAAECAVHGLACSHTVLTWNVPCRCKVWHAGVITCAAPSTERMCCIQFNAVPQPSPTAWQTMEPHLECNGATGQGYQGLAGVGDGHEVVSGAADTEGGGVGSRGQGVAVVSENTLGAGGGGGNWETWGQGRWG